jgi:hypothetical protein
VQNASVDKNGSRDAPGECTPLRAESGDEHRIGQFWRQGWPCTCDRLTAFEMTVIATCSGMENSDCFSSPAANPSTFSDAGMEDAGKTEEEYIEGFAQDLANVNCDRL